MTWLIPAVPVLTHPRRLFPGHPLLAEGTGRTPRRKQPLLASFPPTRQDAEAPPALAIFLLHLTDIPPLLISSRLYDV